MPMPFKVEAFLIPRGKPCHHPSVIPPGLRDVCDFTTRPCEPMICDFLSKYRAPMSNPILLFFNTSGPTSVLLRCIILDLGSIRLLFTWRMGDLLVKSSQGKFRGAIHELKPTNLEQMLCATIRARLGGAPQGSETSPPVCSIPTRSDGESRHVQRLNGLIESFSDRQVEPFVDSDDSVPQTRRSHCQKFLYGPCLAPAVNFEEVKTVGVIQEFDPLGQKQTARGVNASL